VTVCDPVRRAVVCSAVPLPPRREICNGVDDDCDGVVDNGNPEAGQRCLTGLSGACSEGLTACVAGGLVCNQIEQPAAEICDGVDNNCNAAVDEGNPGGGQACDTGLLGVCAAGTTACSGGRVTCNQNIRARAEVCDGLDDDCNGVVDNDANCPPAVGTTGNAGVNSGANWIVCRADAATAWVAANRGGNYNPTTACNALGYRSVDAWGGTCGTVCGFCGMDGDETYDGAGGNATALTFTVHWRCVR